MQKQLEYISQRDAMRLLDMGIKTFNKVVMGNVSTAVIERKKYYRVEQLNRLLKSKEVITIK